MCNCVTLMKGKKTQNGLLLTRAINDFSAHFVQAGFYFDWTDLQSWSTDWIELLEVPSSCCLLVPSHPSPSSLPHHLYSSHYSSHSAFFIFPSTGTQDGHILSLRVVGNWVHSKANRKKSQTLRYTVYFISEISFFVSLLFWLGPNKI